MLRYGTTGQTTLSHEVTMVTIKSSTLGVGMTIYELLDSFEIDYRDSDYWINGCVDYAIVYGPDNSELWLSIEDDRVFMTVYAPDDIGCLFVVGDDSCSFHEVRDKLLEWDDALEG